MVLFLQVVCVVFSPFSPWKKRKNDFGGNRTPDFFCSFVKDKPLSCSVSADRERKGNKHVDPRAQWALTGREGEINKSTTESEVECTTIINAHELKKKKHIEENQALIRGLIKRGGCCRWEGELSPKALLLFVYEGKTTELLNQRWLSSSLSGLSFINEHCDELLQLVQYCKRYTW